MYSILFDYYFDNTLKSQESIYIICDQLRIISKLQPFSLSNKSFPNVSVNSIEDFNFTSFDDAFQTPISLKRYPFRSLLSLILMADTIGNEVLIEMDIGFIPPQSAETKGAVDKSKILSRQQLILRQFSSAQNHYILEDNDVQDETTSECSICQSNHSNKIIGYPLTCFSSSLSLFLDSTNSNKPIFHFSSCFHSFHLTCLSKTKKVCPHCRSPFQVCFPMIQHPKQLNEDEISQ
jgi:hypothetical protein